MRRGGIPSSLFVSNRQGFTLIELMIVVAIIGILASIALSAYDIYTKKAKVSEVTNALGSVLSAAQQYHSEQGRWPNTMAADSIYDVCRNTFGVTLPTSYVGADNYIVSTASDTAIAIQATFTGGMKSIGTGVNGQALALSSGSDGGARTWSGNLASRYMPK